MVYKEKMRAPSTNPLPLVMTSASSVNMFHPYPPPCLTHSKFITSNFTLLMGWAQWRHNVTIKLLPHISACAVK
jgi:hypothetical protein